MQFLGFKERKIARKHAVNRKKHAVVYLCSVVNYWGQTDFRAPGQFSFGVEEEKGVADLALH